MEDTQRARLTFTHSHYLLSIPPASGAQPGGKWGPGETECTQQSMERWFKLDRKKKPGQCHLEVTECRASCDSAFTKTAGLESVTIASASAEHSVPEGYLDAC